MNIQAMRPVAFGMAQPVVALVEIKKALTENGLAELARGVAFSRINQEIVVPTADTVQEQQVRDLLLNKVKGAVSLDEGPHKLLRLFNANVRVIADPLVQVTD